MPARCKLEPLKDGQKCGEIREWHGICRQRAGQLENQTVISFVEAGEGYFDPGTVISMGLVTGMAIIMRVSCDS